MYRQYFNLKKKPFQISSDNQFLWLGKKHAFVLKTLKKGMAEKKVC
jgi:general secretion pathway protein A